MTRLFRDEVVAARHVRYLGTIRVGRNPSFVVVTLIALALASALAAYGFWGEVTRKARLAGLLMPIEGSLALSSPQAGTVTDMKVTEAGLVEADQVLMTVRVDRSTRQGDTSVLVAQSLEQRRATMHNERTIAEMQFRQRQQATSDRIRSVDSQALQAGGELESARRRLELARTSVDRYSELAKSGFVSQIQVQQKQEELLDLLGRESAAERSLISLKSDSQSLRAEQAANANALQAQLIQIERGTASLDQEATENSARRELTVTAPQAGAVTAITVNRGQLIQAGQTVATLIPRAADGSPSKLEAQLFAPSRTAGFLQPGQTVWLRYAAYPYQKFGMARGTIQAISRTPISAQDLPVGQGQGILNAAQTNEATYRVTVALTDQNVQTYGQSQALKPGMALEADVIQERSRIWEWMLDPVLAASGLSRAVAAR